LIWVKLDEGSNVRYRLLIQLIDATDCRYRSTGVLWPGVFLGRSFKRRNPQLPVTEAALSAIPSIRSFVRLRSR
jgi:hypothetical protein